MKRCCDLAAAMQDQLDGAYPATVGSGPAGCRTPSRPGRPEGATAPPAFRPSCAADISQHRSARRGGTSSGSKTGRVDHCFRRSPSCLRYLFRPGSTKASRNVSLPSLGFSNVSPQRGRSRQQATHNLWIALVRCEGQALGATALELRKCVVLVRHFPPIIASPVVPQRITIPTWDGEPRATFGGQTA